MVRHILGVRDTDGDRQYLDLQCPRLGYVDAIHACMDCPHHADPTNEDVVWGSECECAYPAGVFTRILISAKRKIHAIKRRMA